MTAVAPPTSVLANHPLSTQPRPSNVPIGLMWFRRDLRVDDNAALFYALKHSDTLHCVFVFDKTILDALPNPQDRRVEFIWHSIAALKQRLQAAGGDLHVLHDHAATAIPTLARELGAQAVFTNKDYEPAARQRDSAVQADLAKQGCAFYAFKDQCIFEEDEVLTQAGKFFTVFTPYKNACLKKLDPFHLTAYPSAQRLSSGRLAKHATALPLPSLQAMGFQTTNILELVKPGEDGALDAFDDFRNRMDRYKTQRDFPWVKGVSYLSVHMRFGTISIRRCARAAHEQFVVTGSEGAMGWLNELIWRDFYFQIIFHRPDAAEKAFKAEYDLIQWDTDDKAKRLFKAWCEGKTGYPLVDAAQRQLNQTGYQHNRLRMVTASFLTKDLGIDWRWGERYFAEHLNDFDLSANNGGWQWAASSGCDAQPYFRIFNPVSQSEKFDAEGKFIRKYCPELAKLPNKFIHEPSACPPLELQAAGVVLGETYPRPVVEHDLARKKTLERYAVVKKSATADDGEAA
ncbi:MAG TPA: deoxyribodipyrimidine photo-lyase [Limnobacter sp.]|uniref:cryptochrome/photolyase family protein n=1 Tax=Limnobacter sp. TaxID=2003368 RepID=UPI002ED9D794